MQIRTNNLNIAEDSTSARVAWQGWNLLQLLFTVVWTAGWTVAAACVLLFGRHTDCSLRMASRCWAPGLVWGARVRLTVEGRERVDWSRPHLFVSNHQSMIDICVLYMALPVPLRFVLKHEILKVPMVSWYARATGMLFLDRDSRRAGALVRRQAAKLLRLNQDLCLFPEGTRSRNGKLAPFKAGLLQAAIDAGVDVVPIALDGAGKVLPVEGLFRVRPGEIRVRIGTPIAVMDTTGPVTRQALSDQAYAAVHAMLEPRL